MSALLELLQSCGTVSTDELAEKLSLSPASIEARLDYCVRLGYLRKTVFSAAGGGCRGCGRKEGLSRPVVFWELVKR